MSALMKYDVACNALAAAKSFDDVREIHNAAEAMRAYARMARNRTMEVDAAEIRIRAERRLGEMLLEAKNIGDITKGGRPFKRPNRVERRFSLREAGIDKKLSSRAQQSAKISDGAFADLLSGWRERALANEKTRVVPDVFVRPHARHTPRVSADEARCFRVSFHDLRAVRVGELRRMSAILTKLAGYCGSSNDAKAVGEVISDAKLRKLLAGEAQ